MSGRFEEYLSHTTPEERCIVHGDLGAANILCDPKRGELTAVIDWAELSQDDPAMDYSSLTCKGACRSAGRTCSAWTLLCVKSFPGWILFSTPFPLQDRLYEEKVRAGILTENE